MALVGVVLFWLSSNNEDPNSKGYLVAERALPSGHPISVKDMKLTFVSAGEAPLGAFSDQKLAWVLGRRLTRDLHKEEWITEDVLEGGAENPLARRVPQGYRAYFLEETTRLPVAPGDRIDLLFRSENPTESPITLLEAIEILEADLSEGKLVVAVRPNDLALLEKARQTGKLTVALRSPREGAQRKKGTRRLKNGGRKVQIWSEGE